MPEKAAPRPAQVTLAASLVMGGSVFVVLLAFDRIAGLHTMDTRQAVETFLNDDLGKGLGLDVPSALSLIRVLAMVAAACATAAGILGYQILQRSKSARLALTALAAPLFITGVVVGGYVSSMVVGAIAMLWFQPARDWIDGKTPRPVPEPPRPTLPVMPPPPPPRAAPPADDAEPRPVAGFGDRVDRVGLLATLPPPPSLSAPPPSTPPLTEALRARPPALVWGCVLTWVGAGLTFLTMASTAYVLAVSPKLVPDLRADRTTFLYVGSALAVWSLVALVLAAFAWTGRSWAWTSLVVSSSLATATCLVCAVSFPLALLALGLCAVASVLLLRPEVREFINR